jgi:DNA-binding transcriptional ArsR family regulator
VVWRGVGALEKYEVIARSPVVLQALRVLELRDATLAEICGEIKKNEPSTSRAVATLKRIGLVETRKNPQDQRSTIFSVRDKDLVRNILRDIASNQASPKPFRAIPLAMMDLETLAEQVAAATPGWKATRIRPAGSFDLLLQRSEPPLRVAIEFKLGGEQFERRLYETIGQMVWASELPDLVILAVFGSVSERVMSVVEDKLASIVGALGSTARVLWLDRGPLSVDRDYMNEKVMSKIFEWAKEMPKSRSR